MCMQITLGTSTTVDRCSALVPLLQCMRVLQPHSELAMDSHMRVVGRGCSCWCEAQRHYAKALSNCACNSTTSKRLCLHCQQRWNLGQATAFAPCRQNSDRSCSPGFRLQHHALVRLEHHSMHCQTVL